MDTDGGSDLIRADAKGRMLVPAAQREVLLDAFERGGQSAMAFSRQHGIKYPTFANWIQCRRKKSERLHGDGIPAFAEVIMDADGHIAGAPKDAFFKSGAGGFCIYIVPSLLMIYKLGGKDIQYDPALTGLPQPQQSHERDG